MPSQLEPHKQDVEHLFVLALKMVIHWIVLAAILLFVLLAVWIHQWFRRTYHQLDKLEVNTQKIRTVPHDQFKR